jgi:transcription termination factor Rho
MNDLMIRKGNTLPTDEANGQSAAGILEMHPDGYGFLRNITQHYDARPGDAYVPADVIRKFDLREGINVAGEVIPPGPEPAADRRNGHPNNRRGGRNQRGNFRNQRGGGAPPRRQGPRLSAVTEIEGAAPDEYKGKPAFDRLTPVDPNQWLRLETVPERFTTRVIDMFTPIGKGQRGLIVAPPRTGKTILMQHLAEGISTNHPEVELIVLLVDERPEEVTDMRRNIRGTVYASSNDRETSSHVRLAQLVIERSKRLVEMGRDVVVLLDSITRLARAYNKHVGTTGRTMSGGLDVKALDIPKKLFGSARACDEGGSLTVMGTALIETGSRMDDVIFQEFKGTGNMELVLDRKLADRRVFPAIDIPQSGTRKEERLLPAEMLERITLLRRSLIQMNPIETMEQLLAQLKKHKTNADFLDSIGRFVR